MTQPTYYTKDRETQRLQSFPDQSHWKCADYPNGLSVNGQAPTEEQQRTLWYGETDQGRAAGAVPEPGGTER